MGRRPHESQTYSAKWTDRDSKGCMLLCPNVSPICIREVIVHMSKLNGNPTLWLIMISNWLDWESVRHVPGHFQNGLNEEKRPSPQGGQHLLPAVRIPSSLREKPGLPALRLLVSASTLCAAILADTGNPGFEAFQHGSQEFCRLSWSHWDGGGMQWAWGAMICYRPLKCKWPLFI